MSLTEPRREGIPNSPHDPPEAPFALDNSFRIGCVDLLPETKRNESALPALDAQNEPEDKLDPAAIEAALENSVLLSPICRTGILLLLAACGIGAGPATDSPVRFGNDVVPLLTKYGCNGGGCHGKAGGQNGFQLSLLGFEPDVDYVALVKEARGRRVFPGDASRSLLWLKGTGAVPHGGGRPLDPASEDARLLSRWIDEGAEGPRGDDPLLVRLAVEPERLTLSLEETRQLRVTAHFSDQTTRDVTRQAIYQSNEPEIADANKAGLVSAGRNGGLFAIMVRFGDQIGAFYGTVPTKRSASGQSGGASALRAAWENAPLTDLDRPLVTQWRELGIDPSLPADDATFLRRATLDICGTLPTVEEVQAYLADKSSDKKARLIDRLLERPEYASYFALKWADILRNRGSGYSTSQQRAGTALFAAWIRDSIASNKPYDRFVTEILTASGSQDENPPTVWYRSVRTTTDYVESIAQAFLGVRIQCAQCHHHPAERWSQSDYYSLAAAFSRIGRKGGFADAEVPTAEVIFVKDSGEIKHPRTGEVLAPRALGGAPLTAGPYDDPRRGLAKWMTTRDNPFFARTLVNRMWGHFFGRGIIHPIDDARSTNPPSNPELLDALARHLVASGYDVKDLIRRICTSYAYGLASEPTESNSNDTQTFARYYPRRLSAEVLLDAFSQALEVPTQFSGGPGTFPAGMRAIDLPDENVAAHFLDVFGRPARHSACECERGDAPALAQALELVNSKEIQRKLAAKEGYAARVAAATSSASENVAEIFVRTLGRPPRPEELAASLAYLESEPDRAEGYRSLVWSLLATNEFLFNH